MEGTSPENLNVSLHYGNVRTIIKLLQQDLPVSDDILDLGLKISFLPGRFQIIDNGKTILYVAHNPAAGEFLAKKLTANQYKGRILAVVGMLKDKDIIGTLKPMISVIDEWYVSDLSLSCPRGAPANNLITALQDLGQKIYFSFSSVIAAYNKAIANSKENDKIVIFGSFYTVAEILKRR